MRVAVSETDVVREIRSDYKYGFSNPDDAKDYFFKSGPSSGRPFAVPLSGRELVRDATRPRLRHFHSPVTWAMQAPGSAKGSSESASMPVPSSASAPLMRPRWTEQITAG